MHVVVVITQRLGHGFADRLQAGKMDYRIKAMPGKKRLHRFPVADVDFRKCGPAPDDAFNAIKHCCLAVAKIIDDENLESGQHQLDSCMRADVAGAASN